MSPDAAGAPESLPRSTGSGPTRRGRFRFGTELLGLRDGSRPARSRRVDAWRRRRPSSTAAPNAATRPGAGSASAPAARPSARSSRRSSGRSRRRQAPPKPLLRLVDVEAAEAARISTGVPELDRVLGGGLVPASLVLLGGEPGSGEVDAAADRARGDLARPPGAARHRRGVGRPGQAARRAARRGGGRRDPRGDRARDGLPDAPGASGPTSA